MAKRKGNDLMDKGSALAANVGRLLVLIGTFGILIMIAGYVVYPALCIVAGGTDFLWNKGPLGKTCVFGAILLTGFVTLKFPEWYRSLTESEEDPPTPS